MGKNRKKGNRGPGGSSPWEFSSPLQEGEHIQICVLHIWKENIYCVSHYLCIITKYVWKTCVDLGNELNPLWPWDSSHHSSAKQSRTLAPDDVFFWVIMLKKMGGYVMSASCKGVKKKKKVVLLCQHMGCSMQNNPCLCQFLDALKFL